MIMQEKIRRRKNRELIKCTVRALYQLIFLRKSKGYVVKQFATSMGIAWIKFAQMLAMQNIGNLFTETDRKDLLHICDDINPVSYGYVKSILKDNYGKLSDTFHSISPKAIGSASVSQVHKAVLLDGSEVVLKVKRRDIESEIEQDIELIYEVVRYFGWVIKLSNKGGVRKALDLYMEWLRQEIDFEHELYNIQRYTEFINNVNGKVEGCVNICVPKVYTELCTPEVIVMEYIPYATIAQGTYSKEQQITALSSYIKLSFYALFHNIPVIFHGDPHAGNIYIDSDGNIGFLDLGLIFELTPIDAVLTKKYFLAAFLQKPNYLFGMLEPYMSGSKKEKEEFRDILIEYCVKIPTRPLTMYFMDLVLVCFHCSICPQDFLFGMAKAFVCLSGFDVFLHNEITGQELLKEQTQEFIIDLVIAGINSSTHQLLSVANAVLTRDNRKLVDCGLNLCSKYKSILDFILDKG